MLKPNRKGLESCLQTNLLGEEMGGNGGGDLAEALQAIGFGCCPNLKKLSLEQSRLARLP